MKNPDEIADTVARLTLQERAAQLIWLTVYGSSADERHPGNRERYGVDTPAEVIEKLTPGGVVYFAWSDNTAHPVQTATLSEGLQNTATASGAGLPLGIAIDEEGGRVARLGLPTTRWPSARAVARSTSGGEAVERWRLAGQELAAAGITVNLAPCIDVASHANRVISTRSFSTDHAVVATHGAAAVEGLHAAGVGAVLKHFPGHGACVADSHFELPTVDLDATEYEQVHIAPFASVIGGTPPAAVMPGHLLVPSVDPDHPATLSHRWLTTVLRDRLGFTGATMSDSMSMGALQDIEPGDAAVRAVAAGMDVILTPPDPVRAIQALVDAVHDGTLPEGRLNDAVRRALQVKRRDSAAGPAVLDRARARSLAQTLAQRAVAVEYGRQPLPLPASVLVVGTPIRPVQHVAQALRHQGRSVSLMEVADLDAVADPTVDAGQGTATPGPATDGTAPIEVPALLAATTVPAVVVTGDAPTQVERQLLANAAVVIDVGTSGVGIDGTTTVRPYGDDPPALTAAIEALTIS